MNNKVAAYPGFLGWFMAFLLAALLAGCGGGGGSDSPVPPVSSLLAIAVTPATASIPLNGIRQFTAIATYSDGSSVDVTDASAWISGSSGIATIASGSGLATGLTSGTSVITAAFGGKSATGSLNVTSATLQSLVLTSATPSIAIGGSRQFTATATYSDGSSIDVSTVSNWTSANPAVATIGAGSGLASGIAAGTSLITGTYAGQSASSSLSVTAATVVSIALTPATPTLSVGATRQFTATASYSDSSVVDVSSSASWTSASTGIASISASRGLATGLAAGTSIITATFGGHSGSASLAVTAIALQSLAVTPAVASVSAGASRSFTASATYSDASVVDVTGAANWTSGSTSVATVLLHTGVASGHASGSSLITATFGGKTATATLSVTAATLQSIAITPVPASVSIGGTRAFTAMGTYSDSTTANLTSSANWTSAAPAVATVLLNSGVATGVVSGSALITASFGGKSASATLTVSPAAVLLGSAGNFVILTKTGITNVPTSAITGNIGSSPITGAAIGVTCAELTGIMYQVDAGGPACAETSASLLTTAIGDMQTAYTDAAGRTHGVGATYLNVGAGTVAGQTFTPGTYTWNSAVSITTDLTLNGGPNDVWIFQVGGTLDLAAAKNLILAGGALPKNIFWQVAGAVTLGAGSHFEGVVLTQTNVAMITGASANSRLLAQTAVTLQMNALTQPAP